MHKTGDGNLSVQRGRPRDSVNIAALISRLDRGTRPITQDDIMAAFGEKAFLLLMDDKQLVGLAGWQVENLVARTTELFLDPEVSVEKALKILVTEVEKASHDLQCEASLFFLPPQLAAHEPVWKELGYVRRAPQEPGSPGLAGCRSGISTAEYDLTFQTTPPGPRPPPYLERIRRSAKLSQENQSLH